MDKKYVRFTNVQADDALADLQEENAALKEEVALLDGALDEAVQSLREVVDGKAGSLLKAKMLLMQYQPVVPMDDEETLPPSPLREQRGEQDGSEVVTVEETMKQIENAGKTMRHIMDAHQKHFGGAEDDSAE